jgi:hypothetical protein
VRRQTATADSAVMVRIAIYDQAGKQISYAEVQVTDLALHSTAVITPKGDMTLPEGGSYTITFCDAKGNTVATPLTVKAPTKQ